MKYTLPLRQSYTLRDRNRPKINPFPSFNKNIEKNRNKALKRKEMNQLNHSTFSQDCSLSTSLEDTPDNHTLQVEMIQREYQTFSQQNNLLQIVDEQMRSQLTLFEKMIQDNEKNYDYILY